MALDPVHQSSLSDQVVDRLRAEIVGGRWPLDERIPPEPELMAALGVARGTLREALRALQYTGMIEIRRGDGTSRIRVRGGPERGRARRRKESAPPGLPSDRSRSPHMTEYIVKIGFWLRAYDGFTVEAETDAEALEKAKAAAKAAMQSAAHPEHIDIEERREGVIAFIDRLGPDGRHAVIEDVEFDYDRIHDGLTG